MKRFNILMSLLLISIATSGLLAYDARKTIDEEFEVGSNSTIKVANKYGHVEVIERAGSTVRFVIEIKVDHHNEEKAQNVLDRISIDFYEGHKMVSATTHFVEEKSSWWGRSRNENANFKIDYKIYTPTNMDFDITNKYGNIFMPDVAGDVRVHLKYGNGTLGTVGGDFNVYAGYAGSFELEGVDGDIDLKLAYSKMEVGHGAGEIVSEIKYSKFYIDRAVDIDLESKYSRVVLGRLNNLHYEGKYDEIEIENMNSMDVETRYTSIDVDELTHSAIFDTGYGGVRIKSLAAGFDHFDIDSEYTGFRIATDANFSLDIETQYTSIDYPDGMKIDFREKDSNELKLRGKRGAGGGKITAVMRYGALKIRD